MPIPYEMNHGEGWSLVDFFVNHDYVGIPSIERIKAATNDEYVVNRL